MKVYRVINKYDFDQLNQGYLICNKMDPYFVNKGLNYTDYDQSQRIHFFLTKEDAITYGHSFEESSDDIEPYYNLYSIEELPARYYGICELELPLEFVENYLNCGIYDDKLVVEASIVFDDLKRFNNEHDNNEFFKLKDGVLVDLYKYNFKESFNKNSDVNETLKSLKYLINNENFERLEKQYQDFYNIKTKKH